LRDTLSKHIVTITMSIVISASPGRCVWPRWPRQNTCDMWEKFQLTCVSPCIYRNRSAKLQSRVNAIKLIFSKFDSACHRNMSFLANSLLHRHVSQWNGYIFSVQKKKFSV